MLYYNYILVSLLTHPKDFILKPIQPSVHVNQKYNRKTSGVILVLIE